MLSVLLALGLFAAPRSWSDGCNTIWFQLSPDVSFQTLIYCPQAHQPELKWQVLPLVQPQPELFETTPHFAVPEGYFSEPMVTFRCEAANPDGVPTIYVHQTGSAGQQYAVRVETFKKQDQADKRCFQLRKQWQNLYVPKKGRKKK